MKNKLYEDMKEFDYLIVLLALYLSILGLGLSIITCFEAEPFIMICVEIGVYMLIAAIYLLVLHLIILFVVLDNIVCEEK